MIPRPRIIPVMILERSFILGFHIRNVDIAAMARSEATSKAYAVLLKATKTLESMHEPSPVQFDWIGRHFASSVMKPVIPSRLTTTIKPEMT